MTREETIKSLAQIANAVFWAENRLAPAWKQRLKEADKLPKAQKRKLAEEYCLAIATEIASRTSDEELAEMD